MRQSCEKKIQIPTFSRLVDKTNVDQPFLFGFSRQFRLQNLIDKYLPPTSELKLEFNQFNQLKSTNHVRLKIAAIYRVEMQLCF